MNNTYCDLCGDLWCSMCDICHTCEEEDFFSDLNHPFDPYWDMDFESYWDE